MIYNWPLRYGSRPGHTTVCTTDFRQKQHGSTPLAVDNETNFPTQFELQVRFPLWDKWWAFKLSFMGHILKGTPRLQWSNFWTVSQERRLRNTSMAVLRPVRRSHWNRQMGTKLDAWAGSWTLVSNLPAAALTAHDRYWPFHRCIKGKTCMTQQVTACRDVSYHVVKQ